MIHGAPTNEHVAFTLSRASSQLVTLMPLLTLCVFNAVKSPVVRRQRVRPSASVIQYCNAHFKVGVDVVKQRWALSPGPICVRGPTHPSVPRLRCGRDETHHFTCNGRAERRDEVRTGPHCAARVANSVQLPERRRDE